MNSTPYRKIFSPTDTLHKRSVNFKRFFKVYKKLQTSETPTLTTEELVDAYDAKIALLEGKRYFLAGRRQFVPFVTRKSGAWYSHAPLAEFSQFFYNTIDAEGKKYLANQKFNSILFNLFVLGVEEETHIFTADCLLLSTQSGFVNIAPDERLQKFLGVIFSDKKRYLTYLDLYNANKDKKPVTS